MWGEGTGPACGMRGEGTLPLARSLFLCATPADLGLSSLLALRARHFTLAAELIVRFLAKETVDVAAENQVSSGLEPYDSVNNMHETHTFV